MGYGDQLIATGLAKGAAARGRKVAFGDGRRLLLDYNSELIFRNNPNIILAAPTGAEVEWIRYYKGHRVYNTHDRARNKWIWNLDFKVTPGEMYFDEQELAHGRRAGSGFILIEPNVPKWKNLASNKDWGFDKYQQVADMLIGEGLQVCQFSFNKGGRPLAGVQQIRTSDYRDALSVLFNAHLYIGPEGGLHHGAAAVSIPAVVLFGGFIPPAVTGYDDHTNITGGAAACGNIDPCQHCREAMARIGVDEVFEAAMKYV